MSQSSCLLFIETNFLMSIATGRDPKAGDLLSQPPEGLRLAIPQVCFMEALFALKQDQKQRFQPKETFDRQIQQLARDRTSKNANDLLSLLQQANLTNR